ncbi:PGPGW domain-containing protein [Methyloligella sp. 2.7D]|uniref:PGPGW domain-containing protein n=1 Tax=unclassified Methyloligella TaxID=2625955 RepID=UPI00157BBBAE|nr:PGPGW domain-containing protein [Methyloligella sp. GL2]QKP76209.1 hypothetical protein HT051_01315 [Methyloligella sp. GL2]
MTGSETPSPSYVRFGKRRVRVPRHKSTRVALGMFCVIGGILPTPPGPLFIPIGLSILSIDFPRLRRFRRKAVVRVGRRIGKKRGGGITPAARTGPALAAPKA